MFSAIIEGPDYHSTRKMLQMNPETGVSNYRPRVVMVEHGHGYFWPTTAVPLNVTLIPRSEALRSEIKGR
jgi:hypothetical protein